ncbi:MAG: HPP family protein [Bdellovibrionales bacterium]
MQLKIGLSISSHPVTVRAKDHLSAAYFRMKREGFRHMPVIDDSGSVIGIISDRDFQRAMWPMSAPDAHGLPDEARFRKDAKIAEYMSWPVKCLPEKTDLLEAVNLMIDQKISAIVITRHGEMTGIVTHEDLLKILTILLKEPGTMKEKVLTLAYNSPLGKVSDLLSAAGL